MTELSHTEVDEILHGGPKNKAVPKNASTG